jgi:NH3-dependent NAD+ synthetase
MEIAGLSGDWTMESVIEAEKRAIADKVGPAAHVICALSGGVDSTVAATLVHQVRLELPRPAPAPLRVTPTACMCHCTCLCV